MDYGRELRKGNTPTLILAILQNTPQHGYGIAREIERRSKKSLQFKEGTLYPALHAMEAEGFVVGTWETSSNGPPRKVYSITPAGLVELEKRTRVWNSFSLAVDQVLGGNLDAQPI